MADQYVMMPQGYIVSTPPAEPTLQSDMADVYGAAGQRMRGRMRDPYQLPPQLSQPNYALPAGAIDPFGLAPMVAPDSGLARAETSDPMGSMIGGLATGGAGFNALMRLGSAAMNAPRTMGAIAGGAGMLGGTPTASDAADSADPFADKVKGDPQLEALYAQWKKAQHDATAPVKGVNRKSSDAIRQRAGDEAARIGNELVSEIAKRNPPQMPFEKAYPGISSMLPAIQAGAGLATGALLKTGSNIASRIDLAPWIGAVRRGENALDPNPLMALFGARPNIDRAERMSNVANSFNKAYTPPSAVSDYAVPVVGAGAVGTEIGLFPHQYNLRNAPEGSPEKINAEKALGSLEGFASTAGKAAIPAMIGGFTGAHFPLVPRARAPVAQTEALGANVEMARRGNSGPGVPNNTPGFDPYNGATSQGQPVGGGAAGGQGSSQGLPQGLPPSQSVAPPSGSPTTSLPASGYFPAHAQISRQYLDESLTHGNQARKDLVAAADQTQHIAAELQRRYVAAGLPPVEAQNLAERVAMSMAEQQRVQPIVQAASNGSEITAPRARDAILNAMTGREGLLALPLAASAAAPSIMDYYRGGNGG